VQQSSWMAILCLCSFQTWNTTTQRELLMSQAPALGAAIPAWHSNPTGSLQRESSFTEVEVPGLYAMSRNTDVTELHAVSLQWPSSPWSKERRGRTAQEYLGVQTQTMHLRLGHPCVSVNLQLITTHGNPVSSQQKGNSN